MFATLPATPNTRPGPGRSAIRERNAAERRGPARQVRKPPPVTWAPFIYAPLTYAPVTLARNASTLRRVRAMRSSNVSVSSIRRTSGVFFLPRT